VSNILVILTIILVGLVLVAAGVGIGYHLKEVYSELRAMRARMASMEEGGGIPELAIIEAKTPKQLNEERFDEPDEESAIIVAKKPAELRRERDRKLDEELDRLGR
jgi:hypothetical protein